MFIHERNCDSHFARNLERCFYSSFAVVWGNSILTAKEKRCNPFQPRSQSRGLHGVLSRKDEVQKLYIEDLERDILFFR